MAAFEDIPEYVYDEAAHNLFSGYAMTEKSTEYNFVCPVCGDMAFPNKKKAYVYRDRWLFKCYKCGTSMPFWKYIKENDPDAYRRICFSAFENRDTERKPRENVRAYPKELPFKDGELIEITANHPLARAGLDICVKRHIRPAVYEGWYVCQAGDQFITRDELGRTMLDENGRPMGNEYRNRIIMPYYRFGGSWGQFDARAIDAENPLRYRNFTGAKRIAYNIDFIRYNRPFFILEGAIDSTFIPNAIAIGGIAHLSEVLADNPNIMRNAENCIMLWDNDDAGHEALQKTVQMGFRWFDWDGIAQKDVNAAVLAGTFPLDPDGYVSRDFLASRTRSAAMASMLLMRRYGDLRKQAFIERKEREKNLAKESKYTSVRTFF